MCGRILVAASNAAAQPHNHALRRTPTHMFFLPCFTQLAPPSLRTCLTAPCFPPTLPLPVSPPRPHTAPASPSSLSEVEQQPIAAEAPCPARDPLAPATSLSPALTPPPP